MAQRIDNRRDILLLLLFSPGKHDPPNETIEGRTRLVKMLFLFRAELLDRFKADFPLTDENFYQFFPWKFGPFSAQVYDDITFFTLRGFVEELKPEEEMLPESAEEWARWLSASSESLEESGLVAYEERSLRLSERGCAWAGTLYEQLSYNQRRLLREFKKRLNSAPLRAILQYVYQTYPEQTEKSTIRAQVLNA